MAEISKYKVSWLVLVPTKGAATKKDQELASKAVSSSKFYFTRSKYSIIAHQPSKEHAKDKISKLKGKLSKPYIAYIITDAQFGNSTKDLKNDIIISCLGHGVKLTELQKKEAIKI
jgi:hypothetical protein